MRILGLDPGLRHTGWGIIETKGNELRHIANGVITPKVTKDTSLAVRLNLLYDGLCGLISEWVPEAAAVEEVFMNKNPLSTLKLGSARGVVLLAPARAGLEVAEYPANLVKKSVVGTGHADKEQVMMMVKMLLPKAEVRSEDAADALAVAICHAHHSQTRKILGGKMAGAAR